MPDEATFADLPAQVDFLQRKKALLMACIRPPPSLQINPGTQHLTLPTKVSALPCDNSLLAAQHTSEGVILVINHHGLCNSCAAPNVTASELTPRRHSPLKKGQSSCEYDSHW